LGVAFSSFTQVTSATNISTGYINDNTQTTAIKKLGSSTFSNLRFIIPGAMLKFTPPPGKLFSSDNKLIDEDGAPVSAKTGIWTRVVQVVGDGTAKNLGVLPSGFGPVTLNEIVPSGAVCDTAVPKFVTALEDSVKNKIIDLIAANKNFALRYDSASTVWKIITESNIDKKSSFSLGKTGDSSNQQLDASWILLFETDGTSYLATYRGLRYVFESFKEMRFFFWTMTKKSK
jgi:hypothetical protein